MRCKSLNIAAAVMATSMMPQPSVGQVMGGIEAGSTIRVLGSQRSDSQANQSWLTGTVLLVQPQELTLAVPGRDGLVEIPFANVERLNLRVPGRSPTIKGAQIGLPAGALMGALTGVVAAGSRCRGAGVSCVLINVVTRTLSGGVAGMILGAAAGALIGRERWVSVDMVNLRAQMVLPRR